MNAAQWLATPHSDEAVDLALIGAPVSRLSLSASDAWATPGAFRNALIRFPTWYAPTKRDLTTLHIYDHGDIVGDKDDPDGGGAQERLRTAVGEAAHSAPCVVVVGGDNSITYPAMHALMAANPHEKWGLITTDAHHDVRPTTHGSRNGTPVRDLIENGLDPHNIVQIGIHPLGNAREHSEWAHTQGITIVGQHEVNEATAADVVRGALDHMDAHQVGALYLDLDLDVVDRASAPGCPASLPGGISAATLMQCAYRLGHDPRIRGVDLCEVDALRDVADITVRLAAATLLSFVAGRVKETE